MSKPILLDSFPDQVKIWQDPVQQQAILAEFTSGQLSFIPSLLPELALKIPVTEVLELLRQRWGEKVDLALSLGATDPQAPQERLPEAIRSPVASESNGAWLKKANLVGVNLRCVGGFWGLIPYSLTLPAAQDAIHLLPVWEPGVVGSLYGMVSWELNREFFSPALAAACPWLDTSARQLRGVVNLLHATGRTVGMDVIPHTDRFSEMTLAFPEHFEWLQRDDLQILDHSANLHRRVQGEVFAFLKQHRSAVRGEPLPGSAEELFSPECAEPRRLRLLFGEAEDATGRLRRRKLLIRMLRRQGYETVPATMAPPFRGLEVDPSPEAMVKDEDGLVWRDFRITQPQAMSRVFNPLARYKLYESLDDNAGWELDFTAPRRETWQYACEHYAAMQRRYGFDFMRGDMSHVQMRADGVPAIIDETYDLLGAVKTHIQRQAPYFGYFAESFLAPRDVMGYGEEIDHLEASQAEATLGDLQSCPVGSAEFIQRLRQYDDLKASRRCAPSFTVMTADKDDPRFDAFYLEGNALRLFLAFFLTDMPSYMGLGFEVRDRHDQPAPNEHYTKLYVFHESKGPKATRGPYLWGRNITLCNQITRLKVYLDGNWLLLRNRPVRWLIAPDACGLNPLLAWTQADEPEFVCVANTSPEKHSGGFGIPLENPQITLQLVFSTNQDAPCLDQKLAFNGVFFPVTDLSSVEGRVYRVIKD
jgi:hypothetical protein